METEIQVIDRMPRDLVIELLVERDGAVCMYPGCGAELDFDAVGRREVTIDHWMPKSWCLDQGWNWEQIWDLDNLRLMEKKCNADKGHRVPNSDGTLPPKNINTFKYRRQKRAQRPELCTSCNAGRNLGPSEICASCSSGPMPERWPQWAKVKAPECDHELFWCWACSIGIVERPAAVDIAVRSGESGEW